MKIFGIISVIAFVVFVAIVCFMDGRLTKLTKEKKKIYFSKCSDSDKVVVENYLNSVKVSDKEIWQLRKKKVK